MSQILKNEKVPLEDFEDSRESMKIKKLYWQG